MTNRNKIILLKSILIDKDRKSILQISKDLIALKKKNAFKEMRYYYATLMYKKDAGNIHQYANDTVLLRIRKYNTKQGNWIDLANKLRFSEKMKELPRSAPLYLGKIEKGIFYDSEGITKKITSKNDLLPILKKLVEKHKAIFVKSVESFGGKGVYRLNESSPLNLDELNLQNDYIIEKGLTQHEALNQINPHCVNTLRVISLNRNGEIKIPSCILRMGVDKSYKDNASNGGIFVNYDIKSNKLDKVATKFIYKGGTSLHSHPETKYVFKDKKLPYPDKVVSLVIRAAKVFPDRYIIGWDIAYTPEGPMIIEGNTNPCPVGMQIALRGLRNNKIYDDL